MLTSLVIGNTYPRWNTRNPPSPAGQRFLEALYHQAYGTLIEGPMEFVDEFELSAEDCKIQNGFPDYAVITPAALWIIELKTEAGSHRKEQLPFYARLANRRYPELQISITYLTGPMARIESISDVNVSFRHMLWAEIAHLIELQWSKSFHKEEQLLVAAIKREIRGLDSSAKRFLKNAEVVREALIAAARVQALGEQAGVEALPAGLQGLHDLRLRIRDALERSVDKRNVRPWIWCAETSGGSALTRHGTEVGYEIRLSRYGRLFV